MLYQGTKTTTRSCSESICSIWLLISHHSYCYRESLLKDFAALHEFLLQKLTTMEACAENTDIMCLHGKRRAALMQMDANRKKFWSDVKRKTRSHQAKKLCAIKVLHEDWDKSVEDLIRVWNHSSEQEKMVETFYTLHAAHAGSDDPQISKKDYNTFASIVHGLVSINNCGRAGQAGSIRNLEWQAIKFGPEQETKDVNGFNIPLVVD